MNWRTVLQLILIQSWCVLSSGDSGVMYTPALRWGPKPMLPFGFAVLCKMRLGAQNLYSGDPNILRYAIDVSVLKVLFSFDKKGINLNFHGYRDKMKFAERFEAPKIKPFHFSGELSVGLRTVVMCAVIDGSPPFDFQWLKDSRPLTSNGGRFLVESFNEFTSILTISNLDSESNGNYTCRVSNSAGSDEKSDSLNMRADQKDGDETMDNCAAHPDPELERSIFCEGRRTAVMCVVTDGDVPFEFKWFKDGKSLQSEEGHFSIQMLDEFTSILTIKKLDSHSNGNYTCRVTNSAGSDEKSDVLVLRGFDEKSDVLMMKGEIRLRSLECHILQWLFWTPIFGL
ncbi:titin [Trichonephila clavipes]|nr:titin [Trichonephila clavipes]